MSNTTHRRDEPQFARLVQQETLIADATEAICAVLAEDGLTRQELAKRLGKSKGFVTQILSGERNMTLRTFADVMFALDRRVELAGVPLTRPRHLDDGPGTFAIHRQSARPVRHMALPPLHGRFSGWGESFAAPAISADGGRPEHLSIVARDRAPIAVNETDARNGSEHTEPLLQLVG